MTNSTPQPARKEKGIIFGADSVNAILAGYKTVTRRVIKAPKNICAQCFAQSVVHNREQLINAEGQANIAGEIFGTEPYLKVPACEHNDWTGGRERCRYSVGDQVWVREACTLLAMPVGLQGAVQVKRGPVITLSNMIPGAGHFIDQQYGAWYEGDPNPGGWATVIKKANPIFMPRWASRITLEIVSVRIERLQDITEIDAKAEGVGKEFEVDVATFVRGGDLDAASTYRLGYKHGWDRINGKRNGCGWNDNPWVFRIEFKRVS